MSDFTNIIDINEILDEYEKSIKSNLSIDISLLAEQIHDLTKNDLRIRKKLASSYCVKQMINRLRCLWIITIMSRKFSNNACQLSDELDSLFYDLYHLLKKLYSNKKRCNNSNSM